MTGTDDFGDDDEKDETDRTATGHGRPPTATRFRKGRSGNPKGRPRGRRKEPPYEAILGQMVTIREGGGERRVTAAEAFALQLTKRGLEGDGAAARAAMAAIADVTQKQTVARSLPDTIVLAFVAPGSVNSALMPLRMAKKLDPYRDTARIALEPWIVEAALARLGKRRLNRQQQETVLKATRTPHKVQWPDWWEVKP